jgi:hypothetical protein
MAQQPREIKSLLNLTTNVSFDRFLINGGRLNKTLFEEVFGPNSTNLNKDVKNKLLAKEAGYLFYLYLRSSNPNAEIIYYCINDLEAVCADSCSILIVYTTLKHHYIEKYKSCIDLLKPYIPNILSGIYGYWEPEQFILDKTPFTDITNYYNIESVDNLYNIIDDAYKIDITYEININNELNDANQATFTKLTRYLISGRIDIFNAIYEKGRVEFIGVYQVLRAICARLIKSECSYLFKYAVDKLMTPNNGIRNNEKHTIIIQLFDAMNGILELGAISNMGFIKTVYDSLNKYTPNINPNVYKMFLYKFILKKSTNLYFNNNIVIKELVNVNLEDLMNINTLNTN